MFVKSLRVFLLCLATILLLMVLISWFLPSESHVHRTAVIRQPVERVFAYLADFNHFSEWSPWAELDPDARYRIEGNPGQTGHRISWESELQEVGAGSQTIAALQPPLRIDLDLYFEPEQTGRASYILAPLDGATRITWTFDAEIGSSPIKRWFGLLLDTMLGPSYERGLKRLQERLEGPTGG